ncbi:hypothetical protein Mapa_016501 [Marchantia paleacea]|nr:hypothetical protein Mapa_016501 [Marchantia paleacea]
MKAQIRALTRSYSLHKNNARPPTGPNHRIRKSSSTSRLRSDVVTRALKEKWLISNSGESTSAPSLQT